MSNGNKRAGLMLIGGGLLIGAITLGGYYISQNPEVLRSLTSGNDGPNYDALDEVVAGPASCSAIPLSVMVGLCDKIGDIENPPWSEGLNAEAVACVGEAHDTFRPTYLSYHRETEDVYTDDDRNSAVFGYACEALDFAEQNVSGDASPAADVKELLDRYYRDRKVRILENR